MTNQRTSSRPLYSQKIFLLYTVCYFSDRKGQLILYYVQCNFLSIADKCFCLYRSSHAIETCNLTFGNLCRFSSGPKCSTKVVTWSSKTETLNLWLGDSANLYSRDVAVIITSFP